MEEKATATVRILIINYRYFVSGGPERYLFNLKELLISKGHEVIPFSIAYSRNEPSKYAEYFASPLSDPKEIYFHEHTWNISSIFKTLNRSIYSREVYSKLSALINECKPDVAIVLHYLRKLSPSVLSVLHHHKIPFVVRISDFAMVCPNAHLVRKGSPCELCIQGSLFNSVLYRCVKNSYMASLLNFVATKIHHFIKIFDLIPIFVVPSAFTISKLVEGGINPTKVVHIPTFVSIHGNVTLRKKQIVYVGRLEYIKGAHLLLEAINILRQGQNIVVQTVIVGFGDSKYLKSLQEYVNHNELTNVSFVGQKQPDEILSIFKESMVSVCPSLWYDNQPNVVLESLSCATPVIAPDHGSFPELITNGSNGFLFLPGNSSDLANKILLMFDLKTDHAKMQENALRYVMEHHSQETHYLKLINILNSLKGTVHV